MTKTKEQNAIRPKPPKDILGEYPAITTRAKDLEDWIYSSILRDGAPLYNQDHEHLGAAFIGCLWTNVANTRQGRRVIGQAEIPLSGNKGGKWASARASQQFVDWFGVVPDFLLTFDANYCYEADDDSFCALVEHELYHCAQALDRFGMPRFTQEDDPVWAMRGHDVEEFVGIVRRYGAEAAGESVVNLVSAASQSPQVARVKIAQACGTCSSKR